MAKVKHIALFKFKEGTSTEQVDAIFADLLEITENIPGVEDYVAGSNCSPEGLDLGHTHGCILTFPDQAARDAYLAHAEHERFKNAATPHVASVVVFDFEV